MPFRAVFCPPVSDVKAGAKTTATVGTSAMVAVADFVGSATLRAVMVAFCEVVKFTGTVYTPLEVIVPYDAVHVNAVFVDPVTPPVKLADCPLERVIHAGSTETVTGGCRVMSAFRIVPLVLRAVTVTFVAAEIRDGAV